MKSRIYPWFIFSLAALFLLYKYILQVSPSVMTQDLMGYFNLDGEKMGVLAAFYYYSYLLMQIPVGLILDRYRAAKVISLAILACALGALFFSISANFWQACIGRAV